MIALWLPLLATLAVAVPTHHDAGSLVIQNEAAQHTLEKVDGGATSMPLVEALDVDAWTAVQNAMTGPRHGEGFRKLPPPVLQDFRGKLPDDLKHADEEVKHRFRRPIPLAKAVEHWIPEVNVHWPHPGPHEPIDLSHWTIGQVLNWTLHHHEDEHVLPLVKLAWLVNATESVQEALLDEKADLTLFAPDNDALTPPHQRHHEFSPPRVGFHGLNEAESHAANIHNHPFWEAQRALRKEGCPHRHSLDGDHEDGDHDGDHDDDDERREKRKRVFRFFVKMILRYHVSPGAKDVREILDASTLGTTLPISCQEDGPSFRIRVGKPSLIPPSPPKLNFFSEFKPRPIRAKNGVIYIIEKAPLLPPLTPLSELFLFPEPFSTLTSGIQKAGLAKDLLPKWKGKTVPLGASDDQVDEHIVNVLQSIASEKSDFTRSTYTIFAPTNGAFKKLGPKINAILFSPFGEKILKYVLSYHVVPDVIFHTDHIDEVDSSGKYAVSTETNVPWPVGLHFGPPPPPGFPHSPEHGGEDDGPPHFPAPPKTPKGPTPPCDNNVTHYEFPTLLGSRSNETLSVDVVVYRLGFGHGPLARRVVVKPPIVEGKQFPPITAIVADGVAWGGAIHVIPDLIRPPKPPHGPGFDFDTPADLKFFHSKAWDNFLDI